MNRLGQDGLGTGPEIDNFCKQLYGAKAPLILLAQFYFQKMSKTIVQCTSSWNYIILFGIVYAYHPVVPLSDDYNIA
jgi:hypothetical protein